MSSFDAKMVKVLMWFITVGVTVSVGIGSYLVIMQLNYGKEVNEVKTDHKLFIQEVNGRIIDINADVEELKKTDVILRQTDSCLNERMKRCEYLVNPKFVQQLNY